MKLAITRIVRKHDQRGFAYYQVELTGGAQSVVLPHVAASVVRSYGLFQALVSQAVLDQAGLLSTFTLDSCEGASRAAVKANWKRHVRERLVADESSAGKGVAS